MKQPEKPGADRITYLIGVVAIVALLLLGISAYFGAGKAGAGGAGNAGGPQAGAQLANKSLQPLKNSSYMPPNGSVATGSGGEAQVPNANATKAKKEVTLDFLYADWCSHCQAMKPVVAKLESELPKDRFVVRYWNEASRSNADVAAVYADYSAKGYFQGFPTFVANWEDYRVGEMPEAEIRAWVCSKFSAPKPSAC
ncbi:MAG: thioredoxin domain-containing protein [Candidatus Micrarchaeia archaeon]|jgi:thiol-disulfide isomerase/thioredoxin